METLCVKAEEIGDLERDGPFSRRRRQRRSGRMQTQANDMVTQALCCPVMTKRSLREPRRTAEVRRRPRQETKRGTRALPKSLLVAALYGFVDKNAGVTTVTQRGRCRDRTYHSNDRRAFDEEAPAKMTNE